MQSPPLVTQRLGKEQLEFSPPLYIFVAVVWFQFFRFSVQKSSKFTSAFEHLHIYVFMEIVLDNLYCCVAHVALSTLESFLNVLLSSTFWDLGASKMQQKHTGNSHKVEKFLNLNVLLWMGIVSTNFGYEWKIQGR
jgi:hypothetical protein